MADLAVWQRTIVDEEGNVVPGAEVEVRREEDGSLATLYADRAGETPLANPLAADMSGFVRFFAQGDAYTITAVGAGSTRTWRFDPTGRLQEFDGVGHALLGLPGDLGQNTITVRIPSQFPTQQAAIDHYSRLPMRHGARIALLWESGHRPAEGLLVKDGDFSHFVIRSEDPEVIVSPDMPTDTVLMRAVNAGAPTWDCMVNGDAGGGNYRVLNGIEIRGASRGCVAPGRGVKNVRGTGLLAREGAFVDAHESVFTGAAAVGSGAGITAWGAFIDAQGADVSGSGSAQAPSTANGYGIQAAHGAVVGFRLGKADNCQRYGIRMTDGSLIDADGATANDCGVNGVRAFNQGSVNFRDGEARNAGEDGIVATGGAIINASAAKCSGAARYGIYATSASTIHAAQADASNAGEVGVLASNSRITCNGVDATGGPNVGIQAERGAIVEASFSDVSGALFDGFRADRAATINANNANANNCGSRGARALGGSTINVQDSSLTGAGVRGIDAQSGSTINATNANAQRGASPDASDIVVAGGSFVIATGATGGLSQTANVVRGSGVIYDADAPHELQGTWTPEIAFGTNGDLSVSYSTQRGYYVVQGGLVTLNFNLLTSSFTHTTASGSLRLEGLPFPAVGAAAERWAGAMGWAGIDKTGYTHVTPYVEPAAPDVIRFRASGMGVGEIFVNAADMPSGGTVSIQGSITYRIASQ